MSKQNKEKREKPRGNEAADTRGNKKRRYREEERGGGKLRRKAGSDRTGERCVGVPEEWLQQRRALHMLHAGLQKSSGGKYKKIKYSA